MSSFITVFFSIYLLSTQEINQALFGLVITLLTILHGSFFFNSFGLDHKATDRYCLLPVTFTSVISAKNIAILLISSIELFPLLLINLLKSQNMLLICYYCLIIMNIALIYCLVGNITSIVMAQPRRYSHFGETAGGSGRTFFATLCWGIFLYINHALHGDLLRGIYIHTGIFFVLLTGFFMLKRKIELLYEERKDKMRIDLIL